MFDFDLLYPDENTRDVSRNSCSVSENLLQDLQFHEFVESGILSEKEYEVFKTEIEYLPTDREVIEFRQTVFKDLMKAPVFYERLMGLCVQLKNNIPRKRYDIWEPQIPVYKNLIDYIELLKWNYQVIYGEILGAEVDFQSTVLVKLVHFFEGDEYRSRLKEMINMLEEFLMSRAIGYHVDYTYGQAMRCVSIQNLYKENFYVRKEKGIFKKKVIDEDSLISVNGNLVLKNNISEIYAKTIVRLCDLASRVNSAIVDNFKKVQYGLCYYGIGIKLYQIYCKADLPVCFPRMLEGMSGVVDFVKLYPVCMVVKINQQNVPGADIRVQCSDYSNRDGKISIVTGYNSGGKTVFAQSVGTAQIFAQLGFHVPAQFYQAQIVPYIGSLFGNMEDINTEHGKLEQELIQIREMACRIKKGSLLLMNEILSTTSEKEGSDIMAEVLRAFSKMRVHFIFVTHFVKLAKMIEEGKLLLEEGEAAINYITDKSFDHTGNIKKTYRIIRGKPMDNILEEEVVNKYLKTNS